jgi:hypothetical protein
MLHLAICRMNHKKSGRFSAWSLAAPIGRKAQVENRPA